MPGGRSPAAEARFVRPPTRCATSNRIDADKLREQIIADGHSDLFGLYEIVGSLNVLYPGVPYQEKLACATRVVTQLLREQFITIHKVTWEPRLDVELPAALAARVLTDPASWTAPGADVLFYGYLSTPASRRT